MSDNALNNKGINRRKFLSIAGGIVAGGVASELMAEPSAEAGLQQTTAPHFDNTPVEPFWGEHQSGIVTPSQKHTYFATFDLTTQSKQDVVGLLRYWTSAASRMTVGETAEPFAPDSTQPAADSADALGLSPERLTLTFGFGPGLFLSDGVDRFGLLKLRPDALVDLPRFNGDQLQPTYTGGDISVQACADDPQVAFHAVRQLSRLAYGTAQIRWAQAGFLPNAAPGQTHRNLMGFKDGSSNVSQRSEPQLDKYVWVKSEGPDWMENGSHVVVRRARIALEHWDRMPLSFQEQAFGRHKYSGAPIGGKSEFEAIKLDASDKDGNPIIAENAHVRLAAAASNGGAQILRRPYSYNDGLSFTSERWPPWRQGMEFDAGLLFICYQQDPRTGFIKIFDMMSKIDMINQFVTHVGSGIFACPGGVKPGEYVGQRLFEMGEVGQHRIIF
jgi:deferrochelatase/peroxidase EfeB